MWGAVSGEKLVRAKVAVISQLETSEYILDLPEGQFRIRLELGFNPDTLSFTIGLRFLVTGEWVMLAADPTDEKAISEEIRKLIAGSTP